MKTTRPSEVDMKLRYTLVLFLLSSGVLGVIGIVLQKAMEERKGRAEVLAQIVAGSPLDPRKSLEEYIREHAAQDLVSCGRLNAQPTQAEVNKAQECVSDAIDQHQQFLVIQFGRTPTSEIAEGLFSRNDGETIYFAYVSAHCKSCSQLFETRVCKNPQVSKGIRIMEVRCDIDTDTRKVA